MKKTTPEALSILRGYSVLNKNEFIQINGRENTTLHLAAPTYNPSQLTVMMLQYS